jgi:hypothetical protein
VGEGALGIGHSNVSNPVLTGRSLMHVSLLTYTRH